MSDATANPDRSEPDPWATCTFEGAELAQLRATAKLSLTEKIRWLEQAQKFALSVQRQRSLAGLPTIFSDGHIEN